LIVMDCDVLVIGAGILGLSTAYHVKLGNPGKRVVVVGPVRVIALRARGDSGISSRLRRIFFWRIPRSIGCCIWRGSWGIMSGCRVSGICSF